MRFSGEVMSAPAGTLASIAAAAGVSRMTVSLALRNQPGVSVGTRDRIVALAKQLGYRANPLVSAYQSHVRARRVPDYRANIAWVNDHADPHFWQNTAWTTGYWAGAQRRGAELGFKLECFHLPRYGSDPVSALTCLQRVLRVRGITGVLLPWPYAVDHRAADWSDFSVAVIGRSLVGPGQVDSSPVFHQVNPDAYHNMGLALQRVREAGALRIGLALTRTNDGLAHSAARARFTVEQQNWPKALRLPVLLENTFSSAAGQQRLTAWLKRHKPEAVLVYDPGINGDFLSATTGERLLCANLNWSAAIQQRGIDARHDEVSAVAVELVVNQMQHNERGRPAIAREVLIRGVWREAALPESVRTLAQVAS